LPLDIVVVRKIRHPGAPERVLGAVAPGYAVYVRSDTELTDRQVAIATADARREVAFLDARLHADRAPIPVAGRRVLLVDDGVTTGARMIAATRWARTQRARRVAAAVPLAAADGAALVRDEVDILYCPNELVLLGAVGIWYEEFDPLEDEDVLRLLDTADEAAAATKPHTAHLPHLAGFGRGGST
jgi:predicted phosphoribosyltransferase